MAFSPSTFWVRKRDKKLQLPGIMTLSARRDSTRQILHALGSGRRCRRPGSSTSGLWCVTPFVLLTSLKAWLKVTLC